MNHWEISSFPSNRNLESAENDLKTTNENAELSNKRINNCWWSIYCPVKRKRNQSKNVKTKALEIWKGIEGRRGDWPRVYLTFLGYKIKKMIKKTDIIAGLSVRSFKKEKELWLYSLLKRKHAKSVYFLHRESGHSAPLTLKQFSCKVKIWRVQYLWDHPKKPKPIKSGR